MTRRLASNHRILCASPSYLAQFGTPATAQDLCHHNCLITKLREYPVGIWTLKCRGEEESIRVDGMLSSNSGEIVTQWALDGRGIMLRSTFGVHELLKSGQLIRVLPGYKQDSHVWAVFPTRLSSSAKLRVCVDFFTDYFSGKLLNDQS